MDNLLTRKLVLNMSTTDRSTIGKEEGKFSFYRESKRIVATRGASALFRGGLTGFLGMLFFAVGDSAATLGLGVLTNRSLDREREENETGGKL